MKKLYNFEEILLYHFEKYPLMTPQDAIKLAFQSAMGCGHFVRNEEAALSMLKCEIKVAATNPSTELIEPIGGGYVRLNLVAAKIKRVPMDFIAKAFVNSANSGNKSALEPLISDIEKLAKNGKAPFSENELTEFLKTYNGEIISHSDIYRETYNPSYRVICEKFLNGLQ